MTEPRIVINGWELTNAQAASVRVAVSSFRGEMLGPNPLGNDAHGIAMAKAYSDRLGEVEHILLKDVVVAKDAWRELLK